MASVIKVSQNQLTFTLEEAAAYSGIGRHTLETLQQKDQRFPSFRIGVKTLVDRKLFEEYVHTLARERYGEPLVGSVVMQIVEARQGRK